VEPAVSTVLAEFRLTAWDVFGDWWFSRLQTDPKDRFSGRRRSPQQAESLTAAGGQLTSLFFNDTSYSGFDGGNQGAVCIDAGFIKPGLPPAPTNSLYLLNHGLPRGGQ